MRSITASARIVENFDGASIIRSIADAARTCYKSEVGSIEDDEGLERDRKFVKRLISNGHEAMLEFAVMTVRFVVDRGVSHELVRHRLASFAQESTRYCNYHGDKFGAEITTIDLMNGIELDPICSKLDSDTINAIYCEWFEACEDAERHYMRMIELGASPQIARSVLPTSVKTELVIGANLREWRHFFQLRALGTTGKPHPQMVEVAVPLLAMAKKVVPVIFDDLKPEAAE